MLAQGGIRRHIGIEFYWFGRQYDASDGVEVSEGRSARSLVNRVIFCRCIGAELISSCGGSTVPVIGSGYRRQISIESY